LKRKPLSTRNSRKTLAGLGGEEDIFQPEYSTERSGKNNLFDENEKPEGCV